MSVTAPPEMAGNGDGGLPPQNVDAEVAVLGSVLFAPNALATIEIEIKLHPDDFYSGRNRLIFAAMRRLGSKAEPEPVDSVTVTAELERSGELEPAGGEDYIRSLQSAVPAAGHFRHYANIVKDLSKRRQLLIAAQEIQQQVHSYTGATEDLIEQSESQLFQIGHEDAAGDLKSIADVLDVEIDRFGHADLRGTASGFRDLDDLTGGFQPGNLIVLAARPSMGKSCLVTNMAENVSIDSQKAVALFSLEMSESELAQRFIASQGKIRGDELRKGQVPEGRWPKILRATEKLAAAPLFVDDSSDIGIHELRAKARRLHARHPLGLVIVDYLQLMRAEDNRQNRVEQVSQMSRGLKILARELNIPVIAVSQLSRAVESRPDKKPLLSDLRESGQIEQDADLVIFIYREEYYDNESERKGEADLIISKHRNGPTGEVPLAFISRFPKFGNKAPEHAEAAAAVAGVDF